MGDAGVVGTAETASSAFDYNPALLSQHQKTFGFNGYYHFLETDHLPAQSPVVGHPRHMDVDKSAHQD